MFWQNPNAGGSLQEPPTTVVAVFTTPLLLRRQLLYVFEFCQALRERISRTWRADGYLLLLRPINVDLCGVLVRGDQ